MRYETNSAGLEIVDNLMHDLSAYNQSKEASLGHIPRCVVHNRYRRNYAKWQNSQVAMPPLQRPVGKAFDVTYENLNAEQQHCHQTTYGMSERLLGAVVGMHGDDNGLIMPPAIAPHQIVICPMIERTQKSTPSQKRRSKY